MKNISRRNFLKNTGTAAVGAMVLPNLMSCSRNGIVNVAIVGVNGRGKGNWLGMITESYDRKTNERTLNPHVRIVALCDVNKENLAQTSEKLPGAKTFQDFRVMLDTMHRDIDAVVVSTPDHTHFAITMAAMEMGKHVYVEKPLAHNVWQLRTLKKAAKYYNVVNQLGNQGHSTDGIRDIKEWYDLGILGEVKEVHAWFHGPDFITGSFRKPQKYPPVGQPIPEHMDWDLWLGPAKERAYNSIYAPRFWRGWYEMGNGELGDWACHTLDAPYWALDLGSPSVIEPEHAKLSMLPHQYVTDESILRFEFPQRGHKPPVTMRWYEGGMLPVLKPEWNIPKLNKTGGLIMVGEKMTLMTTTPRPNNPVLMMPGGEWEEFKKKGWEQTIPRVPGQNQYKEFINAIRGAGPMPGSDFEYGGGLTEMALMGVMAQRFNRRIEFDAANMKITNHPELNAFIKEEVRPGWQYGEKLWK
ncbi:Gfo/Idh/MocA family oxidoreductase [Saccharicrinis sp. 156]|uniref:Gfo/Idh/MocA family oxidoreductase n=1 Tax=Saccharicrinis sp. 156 TaxID=3417574 RepID=UPI003D3481F5